MFRGAAKATTRPDDAPEPPRYREKERGGTFASVARFILTRSPRVVRVVATAFVDTLDWLDLWEANSDFSHDSPAFFDTKNDHLSPHL